MTADERLLTSQIQNVLQILTTFANDEDTENDFTKLHMTFRLASALNDDYHKMANKYSRVLVSWIAYLFNQDNVNADRISKMAIPGVIRNAIMEQLLEINKCLLRLNV